MPYLTDFESKNHGRVAYRPLGYCSFYAEVLRVFAVLQRLGEV